MLLAARTLARCPPPIFITSITPYTKHIYTHTHSRTHTLTHTPFERNLPYRCVGRHSCVWFGAIYIGDRVSNERPIFLEYAAISWAKHCSVPVKKRELCYINSHHANHPKNRT